jgi:hypothetical protein
MAAVVEVPQRGDSSGSLVFGGLAASAGFLLAAVIAGLRGRRLRRSMRAEDERRREDLLRAQADLDARKELVDVRITGVRFQIRALERKRDELLAEIERMQERVVDVRDEVVAESPDDDLPSAGIDEAEPLTEDELASRRTARRSEP